MFSCAVYMRRGVDFTVGRRAPPRKAAPKRRPSASLKKKRVSVKKQAPRSDASAGSADSADAAAFYLCSLGAQEDEFG